MNALERETTSTSSELKNIFPSLRSCPIRREVGISVRCSGVEFSDILFRAHFEGSRAGDTPLLKGRLSNLRALFDLLGASDRQYQLFEFIDISQGSFLQLRGALTTSCQKSDVIERVTAYVTPPPSPVITLSKGHFCLR